MYSVNEQDQQLVKIVAMENIKMFSTERNNPEKNIYYNIMDAFPIERTGKNGEEVKIVSQKLTGDGIPSVVVTNNSNAETLVPVSASITIPIIQMAFDVLIDRNKIEDGVIDASTAIRRATKLLKYIDLSLLLKGKVIDSSTGNTKQLLKYSLINIANQIKAPKSIIGSTSTEINTFVANEFDEIANTGHTADSLLISAKALRGVVNAPATISEDKFLNFNKSTLDLKIYPTEILDNVQDLGACSIMYKNSAEVLKAIIGKEATVRSDYKDNYNRKDTVVESIGGFANVTDNKGSIRCQTNLLG